MGCIRVDRITEYLCDPLQKCLKDRDPYVRKTATICVVKLHDISPRLVEDHGFLDQLRDLLSDPNPMVVANAVAALSEIQEHSEVEVLKITKMMLSKLLAALGECTEWGQVFILYALAQYDTKDTREAEMIIERVVPRLQHVNGAVVMSAVKVILKNVERLGRSEATFPVYRKLAPSLVSLLSAEPEVQYVALRNINLIVQRHPTLLQHEVKVFFCKYNDPVYVKLEKLDILVKLVSMKNIDQVLLELKEYSTEVDLVFVRRSIRAIGRCAICLEAATERCISVLVEIVQTRVNFLVQQAVIVIVDIFRRYPNRFEGVISILCENLQTLDDPEAKAALVWVLGEYADRISNAADLLETFLETFPEEEPQVQLQLLTSTVKLFLKNPSQKPQQMIQLVLSNATGENDNPDLRDRAYIYWRLLSSDPEGTKDVLFGKKPAIGNNLGQLDPELLQGLLANISTISSVYHELPKSFVSAENRSVRRHCTPALGGAVSSGENGESGLDLPKESITSAAGGYEADKEASHKCTIDDLLGLGEAPAPVDQSQQHHEEQSKEQGTRVLGTEEMPSAETALPPVDSMPILLSIEKGKGLQIRGTITVLEGTPVFHLHFLNTSQSNLNGFRIQFNKNAFGLSPTSQHVKVPIVEPNSSAQTVVQLKMDSDAVVDTAAPSVLQVAVKNDAIGVSYFVARLNLESILSTTKRLSPARFVECWQDLPPEFEKSKSFPHARIQDIDEAVAKLEESFLHCLARRKVENSDKVVLFLGGMVMPKSEPLLMELSYSEGRVGVQCCVKCERSKLGQMALEACCRMLEQYMVTDS